MSVLSTQSVWAGFITILLMEAMAGLIAGWYGVKFVRKLWRSAFIKMTAKKWADFLGAIFILGFLIMFTYDWFKCLIVYGKSRIHFTVYEYDPFTVVIETVMLAYSCVWGVWRLGPAAMGRALE